MNKNQGLKGDIFGRGNLAEKKSSWNASLSNTTKEK